MEYSKFSAFIKTCKYILKYNLVNITALEDTVRVVYFIHMLREIKQNKQLHIQHQMLTTRTCKCVTLVFMYKQKQSISTLPFKAMPHGSEKSPAKNCNEIRHSLCMQHSSNKSW